MIIKAALLSFSAYIKMSLFTMIGEHNEIIGFNGGYIFNDKLVISNVIPMGFGVPAHVHLEINQYQNINKFQANLVRNFKTINAWFHSHPFGELFFSSVDFDNHLFMQHYYKNIIGFVLHADFLKNPFQPCIRALDINEKERYDIPIKFLDDFNLSFENLYQILKSLQMENNDLQIMQYVNSDQLKRLYEHIGMLKLNRKLFLDYNIINISITNTSNSDYKYIPYLVPTNLPFDDFLESLAFYSRLRNKIEFRLNKVEFLAEKIYNIDVELSTVCSICKKSLKYYPFSSSDNLFNLKLYRCSCNTLFHSSCIQNHVVTNEETKVKMFQCPICYDENSI